MDSFLNMYFLFQVFIFKNAWNTEDNINRWKKRAFKGKSTPAVSGNFGI